MKGIIIYEDYRGKQVVEAIKLGMVNYEYKSDTSDGSWINNLSGIRKESTQASCDKDDTYDFETGALIALMKMCGREKVTKACDELYKDDNYKNALQEMTESFDSLSKRYDLVVEGFDYWKEQCNKLEKENKDLKKNIDELFESEQHSKTELGRLYFEKHRLEEKVEKLKLDCEKLRHGYLDTDMIFCGGRDCGKQYKALVALFKKLDQKKVDAAYKEAYNTTLPVWQKEVLKQMYEIRKIEASKYSLPHVHEWLYRIPTKREEMWDEIFELHKESDVIIEVKKEDITTFLHELENKFPEITWYSGVKIFETKYTIGDIYEELKTCNTIYFRLHKENKLSYSDDPLIYLYRELKHIVYLPPMRWDLFKKGRRIIRVTIDKLDEFIRERSIELGGIMKPNLKSYKEFTHVFVMISDYHYDNKPTVHIMTPEDLVRNQHVNSKKYSDKKIVDWEDVR